jgi:rhodanese-related sulfurtransferase
MTRVSVMATTFVQNHRSATIPNRPDEGVTVTTINIADLHELVAGGAQLVEVLPRQDYEKLHLPGAISLPLAELTAETAKQLDRARDVVVYCWDGL